MRVFQAGLTAVMLWGFPADCQTGPAPLRFDAGLQTGACKYQGKYPGKPGLLYKSMNTVSAPRPGFWVVANAVSDESGGTTVAGVTVSLAILDKETLELLDLQLPGDYQVRIDDGKAVFSDYLGSEARAAVPFKGPVYGDGVLALPMIALLPLKQGYSAQFQTVDPEANKLAIVRLQTAGIEKVKVAGGEYDAFRVDVTCPDGHCKDWRLWVSSPGRRVVKAENVPASGKVFDLELSWRAAAEMEALPGGLPKLARPATPGSEKFTDPLRGLSVSITSTLAHSGLSVTCEGSSAIMKNMAENILDPATLELRSMRADNELPPGKFRLSLKDNKGVLSGDDPADTETFDVGGAVWGPRQCPPVMVANLPLAPGYQARYRTLDLPSRQPLVAQVRVAGPDPAAVADGVLPATYRVEVGCAEGCEETTLWVDKESHKVIRIWNFDTSGVAFVMNRVK
jgi:hypothetical protein